MYITIIEIFWITIEVAQIIKLLCVKHDSSMDSYFPNGSKTYVLTKSHQVEAAKEVFKDTGIVISTEGKRYLVGALGTSSFICQYVERNVECWVNEVEKFSKFTQTQPHAAYSAFTHGLSSKWNYIALKGNWLGKEPTWRHSRTLRESHPIMLHSCSDRTTSFKWAYTRDVSITGTAWWSRSAEPSCLSTRATSCFTADQYPTCQLNHQSTPLARWLSCSSAEHQDKNST